MRSIGTGAAMAFAPRGQSFWRAEVMTDESDQPKFARFAAAMDAAREARAPQLMLYDETAAAAGAPAVGRIPSWRMLRRPLGIGGGVALVVALLLTLLTPPIGAALGWLNAAPPAQEQEEPSTAQPAAAPEEAAPPPRRSTPARSRP